MQSRRQFLALGAAVALPAGLRAEEPLPKKDEAPEITPQAQKAIDAGLQFLAKNQRPDGSFGTRGLQGNVAVTGLCGLAFLAGGHQPGQGPHGTVLSKAVKYLLAQQDPKGLIRTLSLSSSIMYGHGYALQFLTALHGQLSDAKDHAALQGLLERGLNLILKSQSRQGGWRYQPVTQDQDVTHTALMLSVLRGFRDAGFLVPKATVDRAVGYVKLCHDRNTGGFRYMPNSGAARFSSTAVALAGLFHAGLTEGAEVEKGLAYLKKAPPRQGELFFLYGHQYAAQVFWQAGGKQRAEWTPIVRKALLETISPRADGAWADRMCDHLATAQACIALQVPKGYLFAD